MLNRANEFDSKAVLAPPSDMRWRKNSQHLEVAITSSSASLTSSSPASSLQLTHRTHPLTARTVFRCRAEVRFESLLGFRLAVGVGNGRSLKIFPMLIL